MRLVDPGLTPWARLCRPSGANSNGRRVGVECKRADAPTLTPSMQIALHDLKLDRIIVAYPGDRRYPLADRVEVVPLAELIGGGAGRVLRRGR